MTDRTERAAGEAGATTSDADFYRGGAATATAGGLAGGITDRVGTAPDRVQYAAGAAGALLGLLVAWSTWTSPAFGVGVAALAGVAVLAAAFVAANLGWAAGA